MNIARLKLMHRFILLLAIIVIGYAMYGGWSYYVVKRVEVNGPIYHKIVTLKDLVADILPPPNYIIESYMVASQMVNTTAEEKKILIENFKQLKKDYDVRHNFWINENLDEDLKEQFLKQSDKPAQEFYSIAFSEFIPAVENQQSSLVDSSFAKMKSLYFKHRLEINKVVEIANKKTEAEEINAKNEISKDEMIMLGIFTLALAASSLLLMLIARGLTKQLGGEPGYAAAVAGKIAEGDLSVDILLKENDKESLLYAIQAMRNNLSAIVTQVRSGTEAINSASSEISSGNSDLSSRTEHQASSLEETAASMEEITVTVKQNTEHAEMANKMAVQTTQIAVKGGSVVSEVIDTIRSINDSSRKIVEIIAVIDGIAFQTNILALNAAVEAARAGEQGRGFAVVATEVRTLAHRSAIAAKEIKFLIDDSVEKVNNGTKLADEAGKTMQEVVDSVKKVTEMINEITVASKEQESGILQINEAISQMDAVTQQNAALVEEAGAAADSLQEQSEKLSETIGVFKI
jgi:methyl-accepting chemotaxis protein